MWDALAQAWIVLKRRRATVAASTIAGAVLATGLALLLPNVYVSSARILPPGQGVPPSTLGVGLSSGLPASVGFQLGLKSPADLYAGLLKSRTVADHVIDQLGLQRVFDVSSMTEARNELSDLTTIRAEKEGLVLIEVEHTNPELAASIANSYVEALNRLTQFVAVTEASQRRLFFEAQLQKAKEDLANAEVAFRQVQEATGLIQLEEQGKAIIEAASALRAQIAAKEVELNVLRSFSTTNNPAFVRANEELRALRTELRKLESTKGGQSGSLIPTSRVPELGLEYLRKKRDVEYHETLFELLARQYEAAKVDESKESGIVQIVDRAVVPDAKSRPNRPLIVVIGGLLGLFVGFMLVFGIEGFQRGHRTATAPS